VEVDRPAKPGETEGAQRRQPYSKGENDVRADIEAAAAEIEQSIALLRRRL
jgi:hypothetical protein